VTRELRSADGEYTGEEAGVFAGPNTGGSMAVPEDVDLVVRAGGEYRVRVTVRNASTRHHVAVVDHLPAGFEHGKQLRGDGFYGCQHVEKLKNRVQYFWERLWPGEHVLEYQVLAATPGEFFMPPAVAEEMYAEETFGRCATQLVKVVEDSELYALRTDGAHLVVKFVAADDGGHERVVRTGTVPHPGGECTIAELQQTLWGLTDASTEASSTASGWTWSLDQYKTSLSGAEKMELCCSMVEATGLKNQVTAVEQTLSKAGVTLTIFVRCEHTPPAYSE